MPKALITGATGFTGRYLAPKLAEAGYEVHGTAHGDDLRDVAGVAQLHALDIADVDSLRSLVSELAADKIVHLAAISFVAHSNAAEMYRSNILGTRNLLVALADCPTPPSTVLLASSANVYGNAHAGIIDESATVAPANDYGVTKAAVELLGGLYGQRLPITVARPFNYTGKGQSEDFLIAKIVSHVRRGAQEIELGNLDVARDFSDVRAVVDAYVRLLDAPGAIGRTFNVCSGRAISIREVIEAVRQFSGRPLHVTVNPAFVRSDEVRALCGSAAKIESVIGPLDMPPFEETLRWMIED